MLEVLGNISVEEFWKKMGPLEALGWSLELIMLVVKRTFLLLQMLKWNILIIRLLNICKFV